MTLLASWSTLSGPVGEVRPCSTPSGWSAAVLVSARSRTSVGWKSSRLAGGASGAGICGAGGGTMTGVDVTGGWTPAAPPGVRCNTPDCDFTFTRASRYDTLSTTETFSALDTSWYLLQPLNAAECEPLGLQFTQMALVGSSFIGQASKL